MSCDSAIRSFAAGHVVDPLRKSVSKEIMAPFVKLWFKDAGSEGSPVVTVGNESCNSYFCKQKHSAVIKSFEYGSTDGMECKIEILDEEGGAIMEIAKRLTKCIKKASQDYSMQVQWGWIMTDCNGQTTTWSSPTLTFLSLNIEIKYTSGGIHYTISGTDLMQYVFASKETKTYGSELNRMKISDALDKMFNEKEPKIQYTKGKINGKDMEIGKDVFKWKDADEVGSSWTADGQNKLGASMRWVENFRTENDKGVVPIWQSGKDEPTVVFVENNMNCSGDDVDARSIGTFVVNAGKCSNVLDFAPSINWVAAIAQAAASGGQAGTPTSGQIKKRENKAPPNCEKKQTEDAGGSMPANTTKNVKDCKGYKDTEEYIIDNQNLNSIASITPIEAELRIQGNPDRKFCVFQECYYRFCSIVAINPWHLRSGGSRQGCPDWTANPKVNDVLTNKGWLISGYNHSIKEGSYVTTLKVVLNAPGVNYNKDVSLGSDPMANKEITKDAC